MTHRLGEAQNLGQAAYAFVSLADVTALSSFPDECFYSRAHMVECIEVMRLSPLVGLSNRVAGEGHCTNLASTDVLCPDYVAVTGFPQCLLFPGFSRQQACVMSTPHVPSTVPESLHVVTHSLQQSNLVDVV